MNVYDDDDDHVGLSADGAPASCDCAAVVVVSLNGGLMGEMAWYSLVTAACMVVCSSELSHLTSCNIHRKLYRNICTYCFLYSKAKLKFMTQNYRFGSLIL